MPALLSFHDTVRVLPLTGFVGITVRSITWRSGYTARVEATVVLLVLLPSPAAWLTPVW